MSGLSMGDDDPRAKSRTLPGVMAVAALAAGCAAMSDAGKPKPAAPAAAAAGPQPTFVNPILPGANGEPTFANPILSGMNPDPSICRVGADFYLVTSSFEYFPGVPIYHSRDLTSWTQIGHVLTRKEQLDLGGVYSSGGIYAPTLRHHGGRFTMITTLVGSPKRGGNFFVTAEDPRGPWSDPVWLDKDGFDPSLLFADGEAYYLRDGDGPTQDHPRVFQARIDPATGARREPMQPIWDGTGGIWPEGAHLYKMNGRYYLFAAEGGTEYDHAEMAARAAAPFGPFEPSPGNPILTHRDRPEHPIQATGHVDLVELDDGTTWAVFLGVRPQGGRFQHLGRETFLAPVHWSPDGWPKIGNGGRVELRMPAPSLRPQPPAPAPARDDFDRPALSLAWNFVRNPVAGDVSLAARPGFLRVAGSAATLDGGSPAAVVQRQRHFRFRCRAALEFAPREANDEAGLTVRASDAFHFDLAVKRGAAGREAVLSTRIAGASAVVGRAPLAADGAVVLEVSADETSYTFAITGAGGSGRQVLGALPTRTFAAEVIGKAGRNHFTGVMLGVYATGRGFPASVPADFDWFEYEPAE
jgi:alpha-N-arabinofuranosidase